MGLGLLGAFWFAGVAVGVALTISMVARGGTWVAMAMVAASLVALQALHVTAQGACLAGDCGSLAPLLDRIRLVLASLTAAGAVAGLWVGHRVLRRVAAP